MKTKHLSLFSKNQPILEKLHISIWHNLGATKNNLKYTDKDQLTLVLNFY